MEITEKDYLINSLTIVLASKVTIAPSELQTLISSELSSYTVTKIKTTLPSTGDGSTTKWLFEEFTKQKIAEGIKKSSLKAYMVSVKKLYSYFSKELNLLTSDDIIEFLDWYRLTGQMGKEVPILFAICILIFLLFMVGYITTTILQKIFLQH